MRKTMGAAALIISLGAVLFAAGCAPLRDQNGHPVLDKKGNEEYHRTI